MNGITIDDTSAHLGYYSVQCSFCKHYQDNWQCPAFKLIPEDVWFGQTLHTEKLKGQSGDYTFEAKDETRS